MTNSQGVTFGALTMITHNITFEKIDTDGDGFISEEELNVVAEKNNIDLLDLSCMDKDADSKVTEDEYILWQQESEISRLTEEMKTQITKDLVGQDADDIKKAISLLDENMKSFIKEHSKNGDISKMAKLYSSELSQKYSEIKSNVMKNTKSAIKDRVLDNVVKYVEKSSKTGGGQYAQLVYDKETGLSDNAKRLLSNELEKEADKFIKSYTGDDLESELTEHLKQFLNQSDKSKLADAISIWEKGKDDLASLPKELALAETKGKAKAFLLRALKEGITTIKLGDITIRSELEMVAALGQYKNYEDLVHDLSRAISQLSTITKNQELLEAAAKLEEQTSMTTESVISSGNIFGESPESKNIFE